MNEETTVRNLSSLAGDAADNPFDFKAIRELAISRRWIILGTFVVCLAVTITWVAQLVPVYQADARVLIDSREQQVVDIQQVLPGLEANQTTMQTQIQIIRSRSLLLRVIEDIGLMSNPDFNLTLAETVAADEPDTAPAEPVLNSAAALRDETDLLSPERIGVVNKLRSALSVRTVGGSTVISISAESTKPALAAQIANSVANLYVLEQLNAKFDATRKATEWLTVRINDLADQLAVAEGAVEAFRMENNLFEANGVSLTAQRLSTLSAQLTTEKAQLAAAEAQLRQINRASGGRIQLDSLSEVLASGIISQLRGQEAQLRRQAAEYSNRYGPKHPKITDLRAEQQDLAAKIAQEVNRVKQRLQNDAEIMRARVGVIQTSLEDVQGATSEQDRARIQLRDLEREVESTRALHDSMLTRLKEMQQTEGVQTPDARVISPAAAPTVPVRPNRRQIFTVSIPASMALAFIIAFMVEKLDKGFRTASQLETALDIPVVAVVPEGGASSGTAAAKMPITEPLSAYTEAIRSIQTALMVSDVDKTVKTIVVTSATSAEGKSVLSLSLARLYAGMGKKTLLLEADLRRPSIAKLLDQNRWEVGLMDYLSGATPLEEAMHKDPESPLYILPVLKPPANPPMIVQSDAMRRLVEEMARVFDIVIIDSAPLLPVNDTRHLLSYVDMSLLAVRWDETSREAVEKSMLQLRENSAPLLGAVLTRADVRRHSLYEYGYGEYSKYGHYYTS
ncbi:Tyrosine-protein kinase EpsD [Candidatus Phaeomarinobacter ectocarpi]|uniref:Tyrosine-protein kinase EpsD n=1 Tax=Candidatus Phaeomarinibacter ectocarpi TaxID=1458461 RepID=X5ME64_9HYPH|nr:polysaccharide biosynthesis tyrosine autokinase [Candidatus Phaeomarinobacter ectocarpi]CDO59074.1 Tyrosine-protein kinase EpsD [Candidatus Phaeomarinobacter ectocarpi]